MNRTIEIAPVRKSVVVDASPPQAFAVFTSGVDRWWPKSHGIGASPIKQSFIEPFVGGRWYTRHEDGADVVGDIEFTNRRRGDAPDTDAEVGQGFGDVFGQVAGHSPPRNTARG